MTQVKFVCTHCSKSVNAPAQAAGKQAPCPHCKSTLTVPSQTQVASEIVKPSHVQTTVSKPTQAPQPSHSQTKRNRKWVVLVAGICMLIFIPLATLPILHLRSKVPAGHVASISDMSIDGGRLEISIQWPFFASTKHQEAFLVVMPDIDEPRFDKLAKSGLHTVDSLRKTYGDNVGVSPRIDGMPVTIRTIRISEKPSRFSFGMDGIGPSPHQGVGAVIYVRGESDNFVAASNFFALPSRK